MEEGGHGSDIGGEGIPLAEGSGEKTLAETFSGTMWNKELVGVARSGSIREGYAGRDGYSYEEILNFEEVGESGFGTALI